MKIAISVESTNDLSRELIIENDIKVIPYNIVLGDMMFKDGEKTTEEMFAYVDKHGTLPKTNAINEFEYTEYFEKILSEYDAVVHICLSSGITSSCGNAFRACENIKNAYAVDSKSLSTGIGLLALYARELADKGVEAKEIASIVQKRAESLQVSFVVERLDYLRMGGRCSSVAALAANVFHIRPRIVVKDGKMLSDKKYKGSMERVIKKYCSDTLAEFNTPDLEKVFITYTTATDEMIENAEMALKEAGFKNIYKTRAGGTIASHCGANTMGILYFNDGNQN